MNSNPCGHPQILNWDSGLPLAIRVKKLREDVELPSMATAASAGFDLAIPDGVEIAALRWELVKLGFVIATPPSHMTLVAPRSSTFRKWGVKLANTVGIVDEDYCGNEDEMCLFLHNPDPYKVVKIPAGTRIAQGVFVPVLTDVSFVEVADMEAANRGGWGSTGD